MAFKEIPPLYSTWQSMRQRCLRRNFKQFAAYGGRGIKVCERWNSYAAFVEDMGPKPTPQHTLDRIDVDGDYEPSNCRWATRKEQQRNRRVTRKVEFDGVTYTIAELAEIAGQKFDTISERIKRGMSLDEVLFKGRYFVTEHLRHIGGKASGAAKRAKTHCKAGHPFSEANTFITPKGWRICRRCRCDRQVRYNAVKATAARP